jgi:hypothetical protein
LWVIGCPRFVGHGIPEASAFGSIGCLICFYRE